MSQRITYFVHDVSDAAVRRRVRMLQLGGAVVTVIGFRRTDRVCVELEGAPVIDLGQTRDAKLLARMGCVVKVLARINALKPHVASADVIVARNLEMLSIAVRARGLFARSASLVYECLDIHRLLVSKGAPGSTLRALENRLWRHVDLILTSSPAFVRNYFQPRGCPVPIQLLENKVFDASGETKSPAWRHHSRLQAGPPWRIGFFGMIRCRKSLTYLSELAAASNGSIEVVIRGRPTPAVFPDFEAEVAALSGVSYGGPYRNPDDLAEIYGDVHFAWAIDYYEEGQNSAWLLANRIYESSLYGAVPLALESVETGRWLKALGAGVLLLDPPVAHVQSVLANLSAEDYGKLAQNVAAIPRAALVDDASDCRALVMSLSQKKSFETKTVTLAANAQAQTMTETDLTPKRSLLAIIPCLNEATHIETVVSGLAEEADALNMRIVVADGGSTDGTVAIVERLAAQNPRISLFHNAQKIQSAAINGAVERYGQDADFLVRVDAHCAYPKNYCSALMKAQKQTGADCVVVSMIAEGETCFQRAAASAQNSPLGNGGSAHRMRGQGRYVDHGHHALMRVTAFKAVGGYDESFTHNEDAELDARYRAAGYQIWLTGDEPIGYFPRKSPRALLRQYLNYGRGRARTLLKHNKRPKIRQSLPLGVAPAVFIALLAPVFPLAALPAALWACACLGYGALLGYKQKDTCVALGAGFAAMLMHFGWSLGFCQNALRAIFSRKFRAQHRLATPSQAPTAFSMPPLPLSKDQVAS